MVYFYSGTPRSGKSLDVARDIIRWLSNGKTVIGTMYINEAMTAAYPGKYIFVDIYQMHPDQFMKYAQLHMKKGKEGQCKIIIDECYRILGSRFQGDPNRRAWLEFFPIHGQLGYDIYLIAQKDRQIDRQIRDLIEYEVIHRKGDNAGNTGWLLSLFFGTFFIRIEKWYGTNDVLSRSSFRYKKKYGEFYDSYMAFDENGNIRKNDLLPYILPDSAKPSPASGGEVRGCGAPALDDGTRVTPEGYIVDKYGFLTPSGSVSSILDNSNTLHSYAVKTEEAENVDL